MLNLAEDLFKRFHGRLKNYPRFGGIEGGIVLDRPDVPAFYRRNFLERQLSRTAVHTRLSLRLADWSTNYFLRKLLTRGANRGTMGQMSKKTTKKTADLWVIHFKFNTPDVNSFGILSESISDMEKVWDVLNPDYVFDQKKCKKVRVTVL